MQCEAHSINIYPTFNDNRHTKIMIPSVRLRIDQANSAAVDNDDGIHPIERDPIPATEIAELSAFRKSEHTRRAREELNSKILEWETAKARADQIRGDGVDEQRPFGLPRGSESPSHIWEMILDHVHDLDDIANLRQACALFRDLLEVKYTTLRLAEVMLKFGSRFGGLNTLLTLRLVCKSTKAVMDQWIRQDRLHITWYDESIDLQEPDLIPKPSLYIPSHTNLEDEEKLRPLESIVSSLMVRNVPTDSFPIRIVCLCDWELEGHILRTNSRNLFQQLLQLIGSSIRTFDYRANDDNLATFDSLRGWMPLMPHLEELLVWVAGGILDITSRPALHRPVPPFPSCPSLKRFANLGIGMRDAFLEQTFLANPGLGALSCLDLYGHGREIAPLKRSLDALQLETFYITGFNWVPREQYLGLRFAWPLKSLTLAIHDVNYEGLHFGFSSRTVFNFINAFSQTLEEVTVTWKIRDTGGYLDLPKVRKLLWRLWPGLRTMDFMVPLGSLEQLDVDVTPLREVNVSKEGSKALINDMHLPAIFPALKQIRARREAQGNWFQVWAA